MINRKQNARRHIQIRETSKAHLKPSTVHNTNVLTVVASESYQDFVANLQIEIADTLAAKPHKADKEYFIIPSQIRV